MTNNSLKNRIRQIILLTNTIIININPRITQLLHIKHKRQNNSLILRPTMQLLKIIMKPINQKMNKINLIPLKTQINLRNQLITQNMLLNPTLILLNLKISLTRLNLTLNIRRIILIQQIINPPNK